jgi:hypothetical protein
MSIYLYAFLAFLSICLLALSFFPLFFSFIYPPSLSFTHARASSGQDLGDGVWAVLAAFLPRTAVLQVTATSPPTRLPYRLHLSHLLAQAVVGEESLGSTEGYAAFLQPLLRAGAALVAVAGERKGFHGFVLEYEHGRSEIVVYEHAGCVDKLLLPPCRVRWEADGGESWVWLCDVALEVPPHPLLPLCVFYAACMATRGLLCQVQRCSVTCRKARGGRQGVAASGEGTGCINFALLNGGAPLGPEGARLLAGLMRAMPRLSLTSINLRYFAHPPEGGGRTSRRVKGGGPLKTGFVSTPWPHPAIFGDTLLPLS